MRRKLACVFLGLFLSNFAFGKCGQPQIEQLLHQIKFDKLENVKSIQNQCQFNLKEIRYQVDNQVNFGLLHLAAGYAGPDMLQYFLEHKFDVNAQDNSVSLAPLHLAFIKLNMESIAFLLNNKADQNILTEPISYKGHLVGLTPEEYLEFGTTMGKIKITMQQIVELSEILSAYR